MSFVFALELLLFALALSGFDTKTAIVASFNFIGEGTTNWGALNGRRDRDRAAFRSS